MNDAIIPIFYDTEQDIYVIKIMPTMLKSIQEIMREGAKRYHTDYCVATSGEKKAPVSKYYRRRPG